MAAILQYKMAAICQVLIYNSYKCLKYVFLLKKKFIIHTFFKLKVEKPQKNQISNKCNGKNVLKWRPFCFAFLKVKKA